MYVDKINWVVSTPLIFTQIMQEFPMWHDGWAGFVQNRKLLMFVHWKHPVILSHMTCGSGLPGRASLTTTPSHLVLKPFFNPPSQPPPPLSCSSSYRLPTMPPSLANKPSAVRLDDLRARLENVDNSSYSELLAFKQALEQLVIDGKAVRVSDISTSMRLTDSISDANHRGFEAPPQRCV